MTNQNYADRMSALGIALVAEVPTITWGAPGQGKSSVIEGMGDDLKLHVETIIAALHEPADFGGLPAIDPITGTARKIPPDWTKRVIDLHAEGKGSIVFFDELSTAPPAVQGALLRPILTGWVGDVKLPAGTRFLAAANPPEIAADGFDLAPPLANRFFHLDWDLPADVVADGFTLAWPKVVTPSVNQDDVIREFGQAKLLIGTFLKSRQEMVTVMPTSSEDSGKAFPTPRTWEMAAKLYAVAKAANANDTVINMLLNGTVGVAAAAQLVEFVNNLNLPDPEELLRDPESFVVPVERTDRVYAIAGSVFTAMAKDVTKERWINCGTILAMIANAGQADTAYMYASRWANNAIRPTGCVPNQFQYTALGPILGTMGRFTEGPLS